MTITRTPLAALAALTIVGAACGGGAATPSVTVTPADLAAASPPGPLAVEYDTDETPLGVLLREARAHQIDTFPALQEHIAACMAAAGFEYVPRSVEDEFADAPAALLADDEFRARYGYGISTAATDEAAFTVPGAFDPNDSIRAQLGPDRRDEYDEALWGSDATALDIRDTGGSVVATIYPESCVTRANAAVFGPPEIAVAASVRLNELLADLNDAVAADARLRTAEREWEGCMAGRGYDFAQPGAITQQLIETLPAVGEPADGEEAALAAMREFELDVAGADADCRDATGLDAALLAVRRNHEARLLQTEGHILRLVWMRGQA